MFYIYYRVSQEERPTFLEFIVAVTLSNKMYMYIRTIPNGFRDKAISLYSSKTVDKKEMLRTVSNTVCIVQVTKLVQFA
jgi:hypothetical protein